MSEATAIQHDTLPPAKDDSTLSVVRRLVTKAEEAACACLEGDSDVVIALLRECDRLGLEALKDLGVDEPRWALTDTGYRALDSDEPIDRAELLNLALDAVERGEATYGTPWPFFGQVAALWSALLGCNVTPGQIAMCLILFKVGRCNKNPAHADSWADVAGYAAVGAEVSARSQEATDAHR